MKRTAAYMVVAFISTGLLVGLIVVQRSRQGGRQNVAEVLNRFELPQELSSVGVGEKELGEIRQMGGAGVAGLSALLDSPDRKQRLKSAWALWRMGPIATNALPALSAAVNNSDSGVRYFVMQALKSLRACDDKLVPSLLNCLADKNPMVCVAAGDILNNIEGDRASKGLPGINGNQIEYTLTFLKSPSVRIQLMGLERLPAIKQSDARLTEAVKSLQSSSAPPVQIKAASMLAYLGSLPPQ
jgi:HEAT repeat protein